MNQIDRVCPRCGKPPFPDDDSCRNCGLDLSAQVDLPTAAEYRARQQRQYGIASEDPLITEVATAAGDATAPRAEPLLGWGSAVIAAALLLGTVSAILVAVEFGSIDLIPAGFTAGYALRAAAIPVGCGAFAFAAAVWFRHLDRPTLYTQLAGVAGLIALWHVLAMSADAILAGVYDSHGATGSSVASYAFDGGGDAGAAVAAVIAMWALAGMARAAVEEGGPRNRLLACAFAGAAAASVLHAVSFFLQLSDTGGSGTLAAGSTLEGIGALGTAAALAVAAVAFTERTRRSRDRRLQFASGGLAGAYLLLTVGALLTTIGFADLNVAGKLVTATALSTATAATTCAAFVIGARAFAKRVETGPEGAHFRRARTEHGKEEGPP